MLATPGAQARRAKVKGIGYGLPSDFELNFGRYLPRFGQSDDEVKGAPPPDRAPGSSDELLSTVDVVRRAP